MCTFIQRRLRVRAVQRQLVEDARESSTLSAASLEGQRPRTAFITSPGVFAVLVALLVGVAGTTAQVLGQNLRRTGRTGRGRRAMDRRA